MTEISDVLLDGLRPVRVMSTQEFCQVVMRASMRHEGAFPSHVLASPTQVRLWVEEAGLGRPPGEQWRPEQLKMMGVRVLEVAGPTRLIWSEEIGG